MVERGVYILGPEVEAFERELADYLGVRHAIGVGNGTDAITIGLRALGVAPGDEVVVPSFTFYASAEAIVNAGARPVFCDVDPGHAQRDGRYGAGGAHAAARRRSSRSTCSACPAPSPALRELGLPVLEDAAQAAGASLTAAAPGRSAMSATFSFYPSKNLGCFGDGGAIATDDDRDRRAGAGAALPRLPGQADVRVRRLQLAPRRDPGGDPARPAARARRLVRRSPARGGRAYAEAGIEQYVAPPVEPDGAEPAWHLYVVDSPARR